MGYYGIKCSEDRLHYLCILLQRLGLELSYDKKIKQWIDVHGNHNITIIKYDPIKEYQILVQFNRVDHTNDKGALQLLIDILDVCETNEVFHMDDIQRGNVYYFYDKMQKKLVANEILTKKKQQEGRENIRKQLRQIRKDKSAQG